MVRRVRRPRRIRNIYVRRAPLLRDKNVYSRNTYTTSVNKILLLKTLTWLSFQKSAIPPSGIVNTLTLIKNRSVRARRNRGTEMDEWTEVQVMYKFPFEAGFPFNTRERGFLESRESLRLKQTLETRWITRCRAVPRLVGIVIGKDSLVWIRKTEHPSPVSGHRRIRSNGCS